MRSSFPVFASGPLAVALAVLIALVPAEARAENGEETAGPKGVETAVPVPYVAPSIGARELAEAARAGAGRRQGDVPDAAGYSLSDAMRDSMWRRATAKRLESLYGNLSRF